MRIEFVPLLESQRDLYRIPRGKERFEAYLKLMLNEDRSEPRFPPLVALNPMAKDHVANMLDDFIALDADEIGKRAAAETSSLLTYVDATYQMGLVVIDDLKGGWTNRVSDEFGAISRIGATIKRGWLTAGLWSSEPASVRTVQDAVRTAIHRTAYFLRHGEARTLREFMALEGRTLTSAGCVFPMLDPDDIEYSQRILEPFLDESDPRTIMECLYGDACCETLGFTKRGLSARAGLAVGLHQTLSKPTSRKRESLTGTNRHMSR